MPTSDSALYLDFSALVKLVIDEPESAALQEFVGDWLIRMSCILARVEVVRAVRPHGGRAVAAAEELLTELDLIALDEEVLDRAATIDPAGLRSLDAVHLAAASILRDEGFELVTYDRRMTAGARELGMSVVAPA
ncbi:MAG: type II toxin-antitoxin system VapC family toxin [Actinomycetota bacterium]